ncbi:hypothetical protein CRG98_000708 [Punica granatum]|uniref:Uncharacterized protein n=1 Tax=Punica granatum TaxID=22663 RepID=A0A2I0LDZ3_PUNGR|nr:hypothetical protein CRG98_000708 [Punica granatum]
MEVNKLRMARSSKQGLGRALGHRKKGQRRAEGMRKDRGGADGVDRVGWRSMAVVAGGGVAARSGGKGRRRRECKVLCSWSSSFPSFANLNFGCSRGNGD